MSVKDLFMQHAKEIPFVEDCLFQQFVFTKNPAEDFFKYAVFYAKDNITSFMLVVEAGKKADYSGLKSEMIGGKNIHFGYIPSYRGIAEFDAEKTASWQEADSVYTAFQMDGEKLSKTVSQILTSEPAWKNEKFHAELSSMFGKSEWLPEISSWPLMTLVFWKTNVMHGQELHWIEHAQGNYTMEGDFLNVELRFGCLHKGAEEGLRLESELTPRKIGPTQIKEGQINGELFMYHENLTQAFSVISHDNRQNKKKHDADVEKLLIAAIRRLEGN